MKNNSTIENTSAHVNPILFTASDVEQLYHRFSLTELRQLARRSRNNAHVEAQFETGLEDFFLEMAAAAEEAVVLHKIDALARPPATTQGDARRVDVDKLKAKVDIVDYIGQYTTLRKAGKKFVGLCPLHEDSAPSLFVSPDRQNWHCFGACSTGGDLIDFVMKFHNLDFLGAVQRLDGGVS